MHGRITHPEREVILPTLYPAVAMKDAHSFVSGDEETKAWNSLGWFIGLATRVHWSGDQIYPRLSPN